MNLPTKSQAVAIAIVAVGIIAAINMSRRAGAPALVAKVPLVGPLVAAAVYG